VYSSVSAVYAIMLQTQLKTMKLTLAVDRYHYQRAANRQMVYITSYLY